MDNTFVICIHHLVDNSSALRTFSKMPPLSHGSREAAYDVNESDAVKWLLAQDAIKQWVFDFARASGRVVFDRESGQWHGRIPKHETGGRPSLDDARDDILSLMRAIGGAKRLRDWLPIFRENLGDTCPAQATIFKILLEHNQAGRVVRDNVTAPGKPTWCAAPVEESPS